jgi:hypothetical protein
MPLAASSSGQASIGGSLTPEVDLRHHTIVQKPPEKSTARELTEHAITAAAGAVSAVGSPLAVALAFAMGWTYNKRMREWLDDLAEAVSELQERA